MLQTKILTKNWGQIDPANIDSYKKKGGYEALQWVLREMQPAEVIAEIKKSGLQGRGGAGFLTGEKWSIAAQVKSAEKIFICNLDESEPGTFKDRLLAEKNPQQLLEGIIIAAYALGASKAYIYLNGNFIQTQKILEAAISQAYEQNFLGRSIMGCVFDLELELFVGAGAYICGEESALINSLEGKRGEPNSKPPYPCQCGLFGQPTVVNNAETIANIPWIIKNGAEKFSQIGMKDSPGTKLFSIDGAIRQPGLYEAPIGTSISDLIHHYAHGLAEGEKIYFLQIGGAAGKIIPASLIDDIPSFGQNARIPLGSGSILVVGQHQDAKKFLLSLVNFFQRESCGQCVPCREGTFRLKQIIERLVTGEFNQNDKEDLEKIIWTLENTTFCPLGKFSVVALKDMMRYRLII